MTKWNKESVLKCWNEDKLPSELDAEQRMPQTGTPEELDSILARLNQPQVEGA